MPLKLYNIFVLKNSLIIIALSALLLTGCFGPTGPALDGKVSGNTYSTSDFELTLPQDWEVTDDFSTNYPENTIVAVSNHVKESNFVANVNVTYEMKEGGIELSNYASNLLDLHRSTLSNFKEISRENLPITVHGNSATSILNVFEGSHKSDSPLLRFYQTYGYKGDVIYTITGTHSISDERFAKEKVENTVRSFEIK